MEYDLFARITRRLTTSSRDFAALASAIHDNRTLWTTLAADVSDPGNGLPGPLRAQLFYLAEFTAVQSRKVLDGSGSVDVLVDINTAVMRGLRGEGPGS
jgi:flagellar biosynthesis activator protein FlaF